MIGSRFGRLIVVAQAEPQQDASGKRRRRWRCACDGPEALTPIPEGAKVHHVTEPLEVALVLGGMQSGRPSVMLRIPLPDGSIAIVETSVALWDMAAKAFQGRMAFLADQAGGPAS